MSLLHEAIIAEKYGLRLTVAQMAAERALSAPAPVEPARQAANGLRWSRTA